MALSLRTRISTCGPQARGASTPAALLRPSTKALQPVAIPARRRADAFQTRASSKDMDFDELLNTFAEKFEKVENKPVVIAYIIAAFAAFFTAEWLIHLPVFDILLGFPIQMLGVLVAPVLALRYLVDKKDVFSDVTDAVNNIAGLLPGLKK